MPFSIFRLAVVMVLMIVGVWSKQESKSLREGLQIFGVRWFLGEKYRFQQPVALHSRNESLSHLVLFFNTHRLWPQFSFSVQIHKKVYSCASIQVQANITERHHVEFNQFASKKGSKFTTNIHKCHILFSNQNFLQKTALLQYSISAKIAEGELKLFSSVLRSPSFEDEYTQMTVFGDWGVMSNFSKQSQLSSDITDCLMRQIEFNPRIRLMLLLGDLAYDLEGQSYINFFTYLQKFSSKLVILFSPGNHQTIKHKDIYQITKQSFYSPFWSHFYGYFDMVLLGKYVFVGYNTQSLFPGLWVQSNSSLFKIQLEQQYKNEYNLFSMQFTPQVREKLKDYKVMGYSHYPTYCSEQDKHQSCHDYKLKHQPFYLILQQIGMQMFFSGHLHVYQRSKQVCNSGSIIKSGKIDDNHYEYFSAENCSIFVIEGAAGNNYYVQTERHFNLQEYSEKFVENTGFGVLRLNQKKESIQFRHIIADECKVIDSVTLWHSQNTNQTAKLLFFPSSVYYRFAYIIIAIILIVIVLAIILRRRRVRNDKGGKVATTSYDVAGFTSSHALPE